MSRRSRGLSPEERDLWARVAASARPIRAQSRKPDEPEPLQAPAKKLRPKPTDFRIGELTPPLTAAHDLIPSIEQRLAAQPVRMDRRSHQKMLRGKSRPEARLDLHGLTLSEAHPELIRFILSAQAAGKRLVLVITGKGKPRDDTGPIPQRIGALRHQVPVWLAQPPLGAVVLQVAPAHLRHGGAGAFYVYLRRATHG